MKLLLCNTPHGLMPMYDEDLDAKKRLTLGETYEADVRLVRNPHFHKKFFALINTAWAFLPERKQNGFRSSEGFRKYVIVAAGYYDPFFSPIRGEFVEVPKSIAFDSMDQPEFEDLYKAVWDVIVSVLRECYGEEEFQAVLAKLMRF